MIEAVNTALVARDGSTRNCQVVAQPAFGFPYATWVHQQRPGADANVVVRVRDGEAITTYSADLDATTAKRASSLCRQLMREATPARRGWIRDGVLYQAAHAVTEDKYVELVFRSPEDNDLLTLLQISALLRDYATLPPALRRIKWQELERFISNIEHDVAH